MLLIAYGMGFVAGFIVLGIFALQVLHAVAEYNERAGMECSAAQSAEESRILIARGIESPIC